MCSPEIFKEFLRKQNIKDIYWQDLLHWLADNSLEMRKLEGVYSYGRW